MRNVVLVSSALMLVAGSVLAGAESSAGGATPVARMLGPIHEPAMPDLSRPRAATATAEGAAPPAEGAGPPAAPVFEEPPYQLGQASWYGSMFHGRQTASGEVYDMNAQTAAHKTLPFDTIVRVTNMANGSSTEVRINDRGPFVDDRIIDLSMHAAGEIGMLATGVAEVALHIVTAAPRPAAYTVQVGAFGDAANADHVAGRLAGIGLIVVREQAGSVIRVTVKNVDPADLDGTLAAIAALGYPEPLVRPERSN